MTAYRLDVIVGWVVRIDVLPDDVLLEIFDFYMNVDVFYEDKRETEAWQTLVHVCRRWRYLVFGSPRRLNLRLCCTPETPAKDTLDVWPALPLLIKGILLSTDTDNVIAAFGQSNRVWQVDLDLDGWQLEQVLAPMLVSFPELTRLRLWSYETPPAIPDSFLGGSAPRLRFLTLRSISFPGLPKLLLSATHLVNLQLYYIPHSGYFSPEDIVASLSVLSSLRSLRLEFRSPQSRPDWGSRRPPLSKRSVLPALDRFHFKGVTEYLEELVVRIDTPQLRYVDITFFNQIDFDCPRLAQFINSTPTLSERDEAHVQFDSNTANVTLRSQTSEIGFDDLRINIRCREPDWRVSSIEQVCNFLPPVSLVEDLYIGYVYLEADWKNDAIENTLWLELLLPFITVKDLYLSKVYAPGIGAALHELVGGRITEVLPNLQNIFMEELEPSGSFQKNIGQFLAARQLLGHPIAISGWAARAGSASESEEDE